MKLKNIWLSLAAIVAVSAFTMQATSGVQSSGVLPMSEMAD